jgi:N-glycosylase/DNA lyase
MSNFTLPKDIAESYLKIRPQILDKLEEYKQVPTSKYFYELCFCLCTPQSKAESAFAVQLKLQELDLLHNNIDVEQILFDKAHYIRFHRTKAKRINVVKENWKDIYKIITNNLSADEKRLWLANNVNGIGLKESAHFLRNIGFRDLGILDRHILKHLVSCGLYKEIPSISSNKRYFEVEDKFKQFAKAISIPLDELDLLFWSYETGVILK